MNMRFTKMHGLGNDYVYIDCFRQPPPRDAAALSRVISDRHFGVGSDGLILIGPSERADARMRMFNADGSEAEMCGNGIRCVAKYVYDHGIAVKPRLTIETGNGVLTVDLDVRNGKVERVTVDMGAPILDADKIPTTLPGPRVINYADPSLVALFGAHNLGGMDKRVTCVSMGNPHAVFYVDDVPEHYPLIFGCKIENAPIFPRRINVHFVRVHSPGEVTMQTWERGSGVTLACGTGACAVAVAGVLTGRSGRRITAHLPGGDLELNWSEADDHVYMTGPAVEVFSGEWPS
jgi:diaminopimelate epimerase